MSKDDQKALSEYQKNRKKLNKISKDLLKSTVKSTIKDAYKSAKTYTLFHTLATELENAISRKNTVRAKEVLKKIWRGIPKKFSAERIKDSEMAAYFNKISKNMKFATTLKNTAKAAGGVLIYLDTIEKTKEALISLAKYYYTEKKSTYNATVSKLEAARAKLEDDYEKMNVLLKFVGIINTFNVPGLKQMVEHDIKVFEKAGKTIKKVRNYAATIEKKSSALDDLRENAYGRQSYFTSGEEVSKSNDLQGALDRMFKNKRYRK